MKLPEILETVLKDTENPAGYAVNIKEYTELVKLVKLLKAWDIDTVEHIENIFTIGRREMVDLGD